MEEDRVLLEEVRHLIEKFDIQDNTEGYAWLEQNKGIISVLGGVALNVGPNPALLLTCGLVPLSTFFTGIRLSCKISLLLVILNFSLMMDLFWRYSCGDA